MRLLSVSITLLMLLGCISTVQPRQTDRSERQKAVSQDEDKKKKKKKSSSSDDDQISEIIKSDDKNPSGDEDDKNDLDDDGNPPPSDDNSGGSGGPKGANELKSTSGLNYMIDVPEENSASTAHGLLILLHGSGASNYRNFVRTMQKVAEQQQLIRVSVLAPNGSGWNEGNQNTAAEKLNQLVIDDLFSKYNINKKKVLFSGQSSGGGFLSSHFVPQFAKNYKGGAFLLCGAAPPSGGTFAPDEATKSNFRLHFEITTGDNIWPQSYRRATAVYEEAGMKLTKDDTKRGGHCAFDQQQVIMDHVKFILGDD